MEQEKYEQNIIELRKEIKIIDDQLIEIRNELSQIEEEVKRLSGNLSIYKENETKALSELNSANFFNKGKRKKAYDESVSKRTECERLLNLKNDDKEKTRLLIAKLTKEKENFEIKIKELTEQKEKEKLAEEARIAEEKQRKAEEKARMKAEEEAKKAEEEAKLQAEEEARRQAEEEARKLAEEEAQRKAEEKARKKAEKEAKKAAEEEAKRLAEEARKLAEEEAQRLVEEKARKKAEKKAQEEDRKKVEVNNNDKKTLADSKLQSFNERLEKWYPEHKIYALDAIASKLRESLSSYAKKENISLEELVEKLGYEFISGDEVYALRHPKLTVPGKEPEEYKDKIESILARLNEYYPDKIIAKSIQKDHKSLGSDISGAYQWLGYKDSNEFLAAYGYNCSGISVGRKSSGDAEQLITELKRRYPNGTIKSVKSITEENPDLAGMIKTISNRCKKENGVTLKDFLVEKGIINNNSSVKKNSENNDKYNTIMELTPDGKKVLSLDYTDKVKRIVRIPSGVEEIADVAAHKLNKDVGLLIIPKELRKIGVGNFTLPFMKIDSIDVEEGNQVFFKNDNCLYEKLQDGSYKLIQRENNNKGKIKIIEGTSIIGRQAFEWCNSISHIKLPKSLRIIEEEAFAYCFNLKSVDICSQLEVIGKKAFYQCSSLYMVKTVCEPLFIEKDAFELCRRLKESKIKTKEDIVSNIESSDNKSNLRNKKPKKVTVPKPDSWMKNKIFVHTGLSDEDEVKFEKIVTKAGGIIKSSTVLNTDYLVYNENYSHETVKLKRAKELNSQGKNIVIITYKEWIKLNEKENQKAKMSVLDEDEIIAKCYNYKVTDSEALLFEWKGDVEITEATIPSEIEGKPVISLDFVTFDNRENYRMSFLEEVTI